MCGRILGIGFGLGFFIHSRHNVTLDDECISGVSLTHEQAAEDTSGALWLHGMRILIHSVIVQTRNLSQQTWLLAYCFCTIPQSRLSDNAHSISGV